MTGFEFRLHGRVASTATGRPDDFLVLLYTERCCVLPHESQDEQSPDTSDICEHRVVQRVCAKQQRTCCSLEAPGERSSQIEHTGWT